MFFIPIWSDLEKTLKLLKHQSFPGGSAPWATEIPIILTKVTEWTKSIGTVMHIIPNKQKCIVQVKCPECVQPLNVKAVYSCLQGEGLGYFICSSTFEISNSDAHPGLSYSKYVKSDWIVTGNCAFHTVSHTDMNVKYLVIRK